MPASQGFCEDEVGQHWGNAWPKIQAPFSLSTMLTVSPLGFCVLSFSFFIHYTFYINVHALLSAKNKASHLYF